MFEKKKCFFVVDGLCITKDFFPLEISRYFVVKCFFYSYFCVYLC